MKFHQWTLYSSNNKNNNNNNNSQHHHKSSLPNVYFHSISYDSNSLYIWIGDSEAKLDNMACSMQTPYSNQPLSTDILLSKENNNEQLECATISSDLANKLSKKFAKQAIVSFNVNSNLLNAANKNNNNEHQSSMLNLITKCLFDEIKLNPSYF
jgi:hypothetical protein